MVCLGESFKIWLKSSLVTINCEQSLQPMDGAVPWEKVSGLWNFQHSRAKKMLVQGQDLQEVLASVDTRQLFVREAPWKSPEGARCKCEGNEKER